MNQTDLRAVASRIMSCMQFRVEQSGERIACTIVNLGEIEQAIATALADAERRAWMEAAKDCRDQSRVYAGGELMKRHILINMAEFFESKAQP